MTDNGLTALTLQSSPGTPRCHLQSQSRCTPEVHRSATCSKPRAVVQKRLACLDHEQPFGCRLDLALPAIDRFNLGNDVDAGGQLPLHERMSDAPSLFERSASCENEPLSVMFSPSNTCASRAVVIESRVLIFTGSIRGSPMTTQTQTQIKFGTSDGGP